MFFRQESEIRIIRFEKYKIISDILGVGRILAYLVIMFVVKMRFAILTGSYLFINSKKIFSRKMKFERKYKIGKWVDRNISLAEAIADSYYRFSINADMAPILNI